MTRHGLPGATVAAGLAIAAHAARGQTSTSLITVDGDDAARLRLDGRIQYRAIANARDSVGDDGFTTGSQFRRLRLIATAQPTERLTLQIEGEGRDGPLELLEAWALVDLSPRWTLRLGQFTNAFNRIRSTSNADLQLVDRPIVSYEIQPQPSIRTQGLELAFQGRDHRLAFSLNEGADGINTTFVEDDQDIALTLRLDRLLHGSFERFQRLNAPPGSGFAAVLGAGVHARAGTAGSGDRLAWNVDAGLLGDGWSAHAAYLGHTAQDLNAAGEPESIHAFYAQGGLFLTETVELVARYEHALTSEDDDTLSIVVAGVNWFVYGRALKLSSDLTYALEPVSGTFARPDDGLLADGPGRGGQIAWRLQLQLMF